MVKTEQYKDWWVKDDDWKFAKCRICSHPKNRFALSYMGERALVSHLKGKKHIQLMQDSSKPKLNSFFQSKLKASKEKSTVDDMVQSSSKTMDNLMYDDKSVTNAEIIWALKNVQANFSLKSCESLLKVVSENVSR